MARRVRGAGSGLRGDKSESLTGEPGAGCGLAPLMFRNRQHAGERLAAALQDYRTAAPLVLALPRGGVPVAAEIARRLGVAMDILLVRKIGAPGFAELALGAVADGEPPVVLRNEALIRTAGVDDDTFAKLAEAQIREIARRRLLYGGERHSEPVAGRMVILVDDGAATGATIRAALALLRRMGANRLVVALPVASAQALALISAEADAVVCLSSPEQFAAVGESYEDFAQVEDEEVIAMLRAHGG